MADHKPRHLRVTEPSPWLVRFAPLIRPGGDVLDLACGGGRHGRHLLQRGHGVTFVDRDISAVGDLAAHPKASLAEVDLELGDDIFGGAGPLAGRRFDAVVVVNYLYRPLLEDILNSLGPGGVLIYQTFALGNERYARPRNSDHLLKSGELLDAVNGRLQVLAYEHGIIEKGPIPGVIQRICAINETEPREVEPSQRNNPVVV